uniref:Protein yippee-like n=1 Tax=Opuntia streptacantha TaxID=393608 RepID=A0A7C8ZNM9_OPUST
MGRVFVVELDGKAYRCRCCDSPLALADDVLSRSFNCRKGRAYLFENVVNVSVGPEEDRLMMSGMHTVADIFCCSCGQLLGWKYMVARDKNQKFKEGKVVLERWRITEDSNEAFSLDTRQNSSDTEYP